MPNEMRACSSDQCVTYSVLNVSAGWFDHTHFDAAKWLRGGTDQNTRVKDRKDKQEHHSYRYYWQMVLNRYDKTVNTHAYSTHVIRLHNTMPSHIQVQTHTDTHLSYILWVSPSIQIWMKTLAQEMVWCGMAKRHNLIHIPRNIESQE